MTQLAQTYVNGFLVHQQLIGSEREYQDLLERMIGIYGETTTVCWEYTPTEPPVTITLGGDEKMPLGPEPKEVANG